MSDFDRLLNLAQKTNGKVFIYDKSEGRHMLLMDLDEYEDFLNFHEKLEEKIKVISSLDELKEKNIEKKDEEIEKINDDIAVWKLEQNELNKKDEEDNIEEDFLKDEWHSISQVLEKKNEVEDKNKIDDLMEIKEEITYNKKNIPIALHEEEIEELIDLEDDEEPIFFEEPV